MTLLNVESLTSILFTPPYQIFLFAVTYHSDLVESEHMLFIINGILSAINSPQPHYQLTQCIN